MSKILSGYILEDYLKASRIIDREKSKDKIIEFCKKTLLDIDEEGNEKLWQ